MDRFATLPWIPLYTQATGWKGSPAEDGEVSPVLFWALALTVAFTVTVYAVEGLLDGRQWLSYQQTEFPQALAKTVLKIDEETKSGAKKKENSKEQDDGDGEEDKPLLPQLQDKFRKAQTYGLDKIQFGMVASLYDVIESVGFLLLGFAPYTWDLTVQKSAEKFGWTEEANQIKISLLWLALITVIGTITKLPFELYSTFQIERKHGFNKQTLGLFFTDQVKSLGLTFVIGGPFVATMLYIIEAGGEYFYLYVWAFFFVFSVLMMTLIPVVIMPLFNKYEPLPDGILKEKIFALAARLKYPLTKLFVMDGSKRSSHSNAFMFGFGNNKRIVLFDTLITQVKTDEILAILGHECGHWALWHTISNFATTQIYVGAAFYFFALTFGARDLYAAFGFDDPSRPIVTIIALMLFFQTLWAPVDKLLSFILTIVSRHNEFAADRFSVDLGMSRELQSGLCKIHLENLGAMNPDPWYSTYHYSHPPLVERLKAMMALDQKKK